MGYDVFITRKQWSWDENGPFIGPEDWRHLIEADPDLSYSEDKPSVCKLHELDCFTFSDGNIQCKNPDRDQIIKMVAIAKLLDARVVGEEDEVYQSDGTAIQPEPTDSVPGNQPNLFSRLRRRHQLRKVKRDLDSTLPTFVVGQKVRGLNGALGTVVHVDRKAMRGLGSIRVRYDDGREQHSAYIASGLELVEDS